MYHISCNSFSVDEAMMRPLQFYKKSAEMRFQCAELFRKVKIVLFKLSLELIRSLFSINLATEPLIPNIYFIWFPVTKTFLQEKRWKSKKAVRANRWT